MHYQKGLELWHSELNRRSLLRRLQRHPLLRSDNHLYCPCYKDLLRRICRPIRGASPELPESDSQPDQSRSVIASLMCAKTPRLYQMLYVITPSQRYPPSHFSFQERLPRRPQDRTPAGPHLKLSGTNSVPLTSRKGFTTPTEPFMRPPPDRNGSLSGSNSQPIRNRSSRTDQAPFDIAPPVS